MLIPLLLNSPQMLSESNTSIKVAVQRKLTQMGFAGPYYKVEYTPVSNEPCDLNFEFSDGAMLETPDSVAVNELSSAFQIDRRHGRDWLSERVNWRWEMILKFKTEVTLTEAEQLWGRPMICPRTKLIPRQAILQLTSAEYNHPIRQQSHGGTVARFTFDVRLSRR